jgi:Kef-type K+ transport system membrane component KefB
MTNETLIIFTLSIIIFISPLLSRYAKIPIVPIEIILGSVAITFGLLHDHYIFTLVAELGFLYLMFLAGLEVDLKQIIKIPKELLKLGILYVLSLYVISIIITIYFNLSNIFIIALPLVSIGLLASLKKEYSTQPWIALSITIGLIGEIVSIIVLTITSAILEVGVGIELYKTLALLLSVFVAIILLYKIFIHTLWWHPEIKIFLMPQNDHFEQDIRISMMIFFIMIGLMLHLHIEVALGAFVAGSFVASFFHHNKELPSKLGHFGFGWLVPIFFVWVGSTFNLYSLLLDNLVIKALLIALLMIIIRLVSSLVFVKKYTLKTALLVGLSHSMPLTLLIAVATLAYHNNSISHFYYLAFILASIMEILISMLLIKVINKQ